MAWPSRAEPWHGRVDDAKEDYATVARAIAEFEPVVMDCKPGLAGEVGDRCGTGVTSIEIPVTTRGVAIAAPPSFAMPPGTSPSSGSDSVPGQSLASHDDDARLSGRLAVELGLSFFKAPFVLEGAELNRNLLTSRIDNIKATNVLLTVVGGKKPTARSH